MPALAYNGDGMEAFESQHAKIADGIFSNPVLTGASGKTKRPSDARKPGASVFVSLQGLVSVESCDSVS